jgi:hypothetical protein
MGVQSQLCSARSLHAVVPRRALLRILACGRAGHRPRAVRCCPGQISRSVRSRGGFGFGTTCLACRGLAVAWLKRGVSVTRSWNQACPPRSSPGTRRKGPLMAVVMIGIDPHKASHAAVAISAAEKPLG